MANSASIERIPSLIVPDKVAMIDIDGTLINHDYVITDDHIYGAIQDAQKEGWRIGLSSDTPYETMQEWHETFGMNGPIIAEKGAFVAFGDQSVVTGDSLYDFVALREAFLAQVMTPNTVIYRGDPVAILSGKTETINQPGNEAILVNTRRQHSIGYFARRVTEKGELVIDTVQTDRLADQIKQLYPPSVTFDEDLNYDHGLHIISLKGINKRVGTIALEKLLGIKRIAMIGNSVADYVGTDIASQLAVADATPQYKAAADYIAKRKLTSGVIDALSVLVKNNR